VLAPAVAAPLSGNGHAQKQPDGYLGSSNGVIHDVGVLASRNGRAHDLAEDDPDARPEPWRDNDPGAPEPDTAAPPPSYLPSPSGRRRIRVVGQPGEAPAT
jgi:hypothetical protein